MKAKTKVSGDELLERRKLSHSHTAKVECRIAGEIQELDLGEGHATRVQGRQASGTEVQDDKG